MALKILLIEDELAIREALAFHLERNGYLVHLATTAYEAWQVLENMIEQPIDCAVLDWMLPDESGLEWLARLRRHPTFGRLPVLMLTARANEADRIAGLDAGADDYLSKPFSPAELTARLRALLRRSQQQAHELLEIGPIKMDFHTGSAFFEGRELSLTRREFDLLAFLARHPDRVYSRQELLDHVWGADFLGGERTVDQHVTQLRALLRNQPEGPQLIETVRGRGYRLRSTSTRGSS